MSVKTQLAADVKADKTGGVPGVAATDNSPSVTDEKSPKLDKAFPTLSKEDSDVKHELNHRRLTPRMIQLLSLAGTVGALTRFLPLFTALTRCFLQTETDATLFVVIGSPLQAGGPGNLFIGMCIWVSAVYFVALSQSEMVSFL